MKQFIALLFVLFTTSFTASADPGRLFALVPFNDKLPLTEEILLLNREEHLVLMPAQERKESGKFQIGAMNSEEMSKRFQAAEQTLIIPYKEIPEGYQILAATWVGRMEEGSNGWVLALGRGNHEDGSMTIAKAIVYTQTAKQANLEQTFQGAQSKQEKLQSLLSKTKFSFEMWFEEARLSNGQVQQIVGLVPSLFRNPHDRLSWEHLKLHSFIVPIHGMEVDNYLALGLGDPLLAPQWVFGGTTASTLDLDSKIRHVLYVQAGGLAIPEVYSNGLLVMNISPLALRRAYDPLDKLYQSIAGSSRPRFSEAEHYIQLYGAEAGLVPKPSPLENEGLSIMTIGDDGFPVVLEGQGSSLIGSGAFDEVTFDKMPRSYYEGTLPPVFHCEGSLSGTVVDAVELHNATFVGLIVDDPVGPAAKPKAKKLPAVAKKKPATEKKKAEAKKKTPAKKKKPAKKK